VRGREARPPRSTTALTGTRARSGAAVTANPRASRVVVCAYGSTWTQQRPKLTKKRRNGSGTIRIQGWHCRQEGTIGLIGGSEHVPTMQSASPGTRKGTWEYPRQGRGSRCHVRARISEWSRLQAFGCTAERTLVSRAGPDVVSPSAQLCLLHDSRREG
jgi:hypothetical protein